MSVTAEDSSVCTRCGSVLHEMALFRGYVCIWAPFVAALHFIVLLT